MSWRQPIGRSGYSRAAVCRRGHFQTPNIDKHHVGDRCETCGAKVLAACESCDAQIRGYELGGIAVVGGWTPPTFCFACGAPFPWADRQARIYELENLLDEEDISEVDRLDAREALERLRRSGTDDAEDLDEEAQARLWQRVREKAPGLLAGSGKAIVESVVTAAVKAQLGL